MGEKNLVEIELLSGKRIILPKRWEKVYNACEKTGWLIRMSSAFPFFKFEKCRYVKFKFRTHYETLNDRLDPTYRVNCTLFQFASMFGVEIEPFERMLVENDLTCNC